MLSQRPGKLLFMYTLVIIVIILSIGHSLNKIEEIAHIFFPLKDSKDFIVESLKILIGSSLAGFAAILVTNVWQQKSLGIELLKELNSPEFLEIRSILSNQKRICRQRNIDFEDVSHWFPHNNSPVIENNGKIVILDKFKKDHALANMFYYIIRLSSYSKNGMLDIDTVKSIFHTFFAHHEILLLEFINALERYTEHDFNSEHYNNYQHNRKLWYKRIESIQFFFKLIGLHSSLSKNHRYIYFPSLNVKEADRPIERIFAVNFPIEDSITLNVYDFKAEIENLKAKILLIENRVNDNRNFFKKLIG